MRQIILCAFLPLLAPAFAAQPHGQEDDITVLTLAFAPKMQTVPA